MKRSLLIIMCFVIWLTSYVRADHIEVCGDVSGVWSVDTVIVFCDVRIPPGDTLIIQPGVLVLFHGYHKITVDTGAVFQAVGNLVDTIKFEERFVGNSWHGIRFIFASGSSQLGYCSFRNGSAIGDEEDANGGALYLQSSSILIQNSLFDSCSADSAGGAIFCTFNSHPIIIGNLISRNSAEHAGGGIACYSNSNPEISGNAFRSNYAHDKGGAVYCLQSSPTIDHDTLVENLAGSGGAVFCDESDAIISNNLISENHTRIWGSGGAIYCTWFCTPRIDSNTIVGNTAYWGGGAIYCDYCDPTIRDNLISYDSSSYGAAIHCDGSSAEIIGNSIINNIAHHSTVGGGAILCSSDSHPLIKMNVISGNRAEGDGGAVYCDYFSNPNILSNIITKNISGNNGGGVALFDSYPTLSQNTIADNVALLNGGAVYCYTSSPIIQNSILFFNHSQDTSQIYLINGSSAEVRYSDVQSGWPGEGNIDPDPLFRDAANGDYHLQSMTNPVCGGPGDSPCIDAGDPSQCDTLLHCDWGLGDSTSDMGAYGGGCYNQVGIFDEDDRTMPTGYWLSQNYPNPFNPVTEISFNLPEVVDVKLEIYNVLGQRVTTLVNGLTEAGIHSVTWDGSDVASGIYLYHLQAGNFVETKKMVLLK